MLTLQVYCMIKGLVGPTEYRYTLLERASVVWFGTDRRYAAVRENVTLSTAPKCQE